MSKKEPRNMAKEAFFFLLIHIIIWINRKNGYAACGCKKKKTCVHLLVLTLREEIREVYQTTVAPEFCLFDSSIG